jgi:predicted nucleotidyltransferase
MSINRESIVALLREEVPGLLAVYAFGSRIRGDSINESDLDLAVLVAGYADAMQLWQLAGSLANIADCPVDLLDLRRTSSVMQHQVLVTGERWWAASSEADLVECAMLNDKLALDETRAPLLDDIQRDGRVYGR